MKDFNEKNSTWVSRYFLIYPESSITIVYNILFVYHFCCPFHPFTRFYISLGPPCKVKTTKLQSLEFENYDNFPEFDVKVLDKYNQPSIINNPETKLALICEAFTNQVVTSSVSNGKAKFPATPIKVDSITEPMTQEVSISLVIPEVRKKKTFVSRTIKELDKFEITIKPSSIFRDIEIVQVDSSSTPSDGPRAAGNSCLSLEAVAGSVVQSLKVVAYNESGERLTDEEFLEFEPRVTATWSEVRVLNQLNSFKPFN